MPAQCHKDSAMSKTNKEHTSPRARAQRNPLHLSCARRKMTPDSLVLWPTLSNWLGLHLWHLPAHTSCSAKSLLTGWFSSSTLQSLPTEGNRTKEATKTPLLYREWNSRDPIRWVKLLKESKMNLGIQAKSWSFTICSKQHTCQDTHRTHPFLQRKTEPPQVFPGTYHSSPSTVELNF